MSLSVVWGVNAQKLSMPASNLLAKGKDHWFGAAGQEQEVDWMRESKRPGYKFVNRGVCERHSNPVDLGDFGMAPSRPTDPLSAMLLTYYGIYHCQLLILQLL